jgi:N-acetyl-anhydromuramyl-L-alanine amidase AmpD
MKNRINRMKKYIFSCITLCSLLFSTVYAQKAGGEYAAYFKEAYKKYPNIPNGVLEAVAYTNTRTHHLMPDNDPVGSCTDMPKYYGVMGLVEDGKNYFKNNLQTVADLSGYSVAEIKKDPRINILAYAAAYSQTLQGTGETSRDITQHKNILAELSEFPTTRGDLNDYVTDQMFYGILHKMADEKREIYDYKKIFGAEKAKVLTAKKVDVSNGSPYRPGERGGEFSCTAGKAGPDHTEAIWSPAAKSNFGVGRKGQEIDLVVIHTTQGSYASCISWFRNSQARVSAHYVVRSFDGQITQMVCEKDRAFHAGGEDNLISVGIEHEGFIEDGASWYTNEMYKASALLTKDICKRNGIDPLKMYTGKGYNKAMDLSNKCRKIKGHQHLPSNQNGHIDPGADWDWERYYQLVNGELPKDIKTYTATSGDIYDTGGATGNYKEQERTGYLIQPANATGISLEFKEMDMEGTNDKPYDYLDIYAGKNANGEYIGRFTGNKIPPKINIKGSSVYMEFRSDCAGNEGGWKLTYSASTKAVACSAPKEGTTDEIYPMGAKLAWTKTGSADVYLVQIRRNNDEKWTNYKTTKNYLNVTGLNQSGLYKWKVKAICGNDTSAAEALTLNTTSVSRSGNPKHYVTKATDGKFYDSGALTNGYSPLEDYTLSILPENGGKVQLTFKNFETEPDKDILYIYDGQNTKGKLLGTYSGSKSIPVITSTKGALTFRFKSDKGTQSKGWNAEWKTIGTGTVVEPDEESENTSGGGSTAGGNDTPPSGGGTTPSGGGNGNNGGSTAGGDDTDPSNGGTQPSTDEWNVALKYDSKSPVTKPKLAEVYSKNTTISFEDKANTPKGIGNLFYLIAENTGNGWRANPDKGFYLEEFNKGLGAEWKSVSGKWDVKDGRARQSDPTTTNSNMYAKLAQGKSSYLYQWQARMTGTGSNKRMGLHIFCGAPEKENRGGSYFIWVRDVEGGDKIEIYKTDAAEKFAVKASANFTIENGVTYDYKVLYNANSGRIEVYVNNKFIVSWVDKAPITAGKAISFRSAGCVAEFDNVRVFKGRNKTVNVTVGKEATNDIRIASANPKSSGLRVYSLMLDMENRWSQEVYAAARVDFSLTRGDGLPPAPAPAKPAEEHSDDFSITDKPNPNILQSYYLVADYDGTGWGANEKCGFYYNDFEYSKLGQKWYQGDGEWELGEGTLHQKDDKIANTMASRTISQKKGGNYLYHFRAKINSEGDGRRFGLHFFSDNPSAENRGSGYLVWFRNNEKTPDKVEIYRSVDNKLGDNTASAPVTLEAGQWCDVKVVLETATGKVTVWLNDKKALSWKDPYPLMEGGTCVSLRTGMASVEFDDLRFYQQRPAKTLITVGSKETDMLKNESQNNKPSGRVYLLSRDKTDKWINVERKDIKVKLKL